MEGKIKADRLISLDVFRGITIAGMILVNNPGSWAYVYPPMRHAEWNGWTPTDLIFPFFLFIVGVAMAYSFSSFFSRGYTKKSLIRKVIRRTLIIFGLGLFLAAFPYFKIWTIRIPGVLQRIALCYFFASLIVLNGGWKSRAWWAAGLLAFYWIVMKLVPVPGIGAGVLTPENNLAAFIDRLVLSGHMWSQTKVWDPEGLLSTIPAIATTLTGVLTGEWLRTNRSPEEKTAWLMIAGNLAVFAGYVINPFFPFNKSIWTSSYVVLTSGMALIFLGICYWTVDVMKWRKWTKPFVIYGMNSIAVFVLSGLVTKSLILIKFATEDGGKTSLYSMIYRNLFASWLGPLNGSLGFALTYILVFLGLMWLLDRKGIYIKV